MNIIGQILVGWFIIDLLTGLYHYVIDHLPLGTVPLLDGQVNDFQQHHINRHSMEVGGFWFRNRATIIGSLPALLFAWLMPDLAAFWLTIWVGGSVSQQAHHYAHVANPPVAAKVLQQLGVFISPAAHERHHSDFERSYGVLNGWSHGFLDLMLGRIW